MQVKTALSRSGLPGLDYALNPYRGCAHACGYCYAPDIIHLGNSEVWGECVEPKENLPLLLAKELKRKEMGVVGIGTVTDPYQPIEEKYLITRHCLEQLARKGGPVTVQTKSDLVTRDIDILKRMNVEVIFTITTLDRELAERIEPGAPSPERRLKAMTEISAAGIKTWTFLGPVIPGMNDSHESLEGVIRATKKAGGRSVMYDRLRIKPRMGARFAINTEEKKLVTADPDWVRKLAESVEDICSGVGIECKSAF